MGQGNLPRYCYANTTDEVPDVLIRDRDFTVTSTVTQPLCFGDKGSIQLAANDVDPQYFFSLYQGGTLINSVGIYYAGDLFEGGISVLNIPSRRSGLNPSNILFDPIISFYLESFFFVGNQSNRVTPSILLMTNGSATQITTGAIGEFGNILAGLSIRGFSSKSIDGLNFIIGSKVNPKLRISYSYDYGLNSLQVFSEGSHELQINYNLNKQISWGLPPKIRYNPRSL